MTTMWPERTQKTSGTETYDQPIGYIANESFEDPDVELERLMHQRRPVRRSRQRRGQPPAELPAHLARLCEVDLLTAEEERNLFRSMNYFKYRAYELQQQLLADPANQQHRVLRQRYLNAAEAVRDDILEANMRLVVSIVRKFVTPQDSFDELLSEGIEALMQAAEKFDFDRGFRFSTYAYRVIARSAFRKVNQRRKELNQATTEIDEQVMQAGDTKARSQVDEQTWNRVDQELERLMRSLDRREAFIIRSRYALGEHHGKGRTFQAIADDLGVSKERVRQLEQRAVAKLRKLAGELDELAEPLMC